MAFKNEAEFESHIRALIADRITSKNSSVYALDNKKAVDIVICRDNLSPVAFFLEVKYFQRSHGRLGFGSGEGAGFQPEILLKKPVFFEAYLRWVLGSDAHTGAGYWFVTSETLRQYVAAGKVGVKHNNIQEALFRNVPSITEEQFTGALYAWIHNT